MKLRLEQRELWNVLKYSYDRNKVLKGNPDLLAAIEISARLNRVIEPLAYYIYELGTRVIVKKGYQSFAYREDMLHHAVIITMQSIMRFDTKKSDNPCAYLVVCIQSACVNYMHKERKEEHIKEALVGRVLHAQDID